MDDRQTAKVIHFYDKISVAVLKLNQELKLGDQIKFVRENQEFTQTVTSMQLDHKSVGKAEKDSEVAIKVDQAVKKGTKVYKV